MTSTFQCEYCQSYTFKRCDKFKLKCTSHGGMYSAHSFGFGVGVEVIRSLMISVYNSVAYEPCDLVKTRLSEFEAEAEWYQTNNNVRFHAL